MLNRLVERGAVVVKAEGKRKSFYHVAERMFNIYYLMRKRGESSSLVRAVVDFMKYYYEPKEFLGIVRSMTEEACKYGIESCKYNFDAYQEIIRNAPDTLIRGILDATHPEFLELPLVKAFIAGKTHDGIELKPGGEIEALAWFLLAQILDKRLARYKEAEKAYRKVIELDSDMVQPIASLLSLMFKQNRHADAIMLAEKCINEQSDNAILLDALARAIYKNDETTLIKQALPWILNAVSISPNNATFHHTLACILCRLDKGEEAIIPARKYLADNKLVKNKYNISNTIELLTLLAAVGHPEEALEMLIASPHADLYEPLTVALKMYLNQEVRTTVEIAEVANDIINDINEKKKR
jgi:tetratricopeptide (TPR) repeat protein